MDFAATDRTIDWMDRQYTFAWLVLQKTEFAIGKKPAMTSSDVFRVIIAHTKFPFSPTGVNSGAEMATIHVARNLANLGVKVDVFCILNGQGGVYDGVEYHGFPTYEELCRTLATFDEPANIVIANSVEALESASLNGRFIKRLLWVHAPADSYRPQLEIINRHADAIVHVSNHQKVLAEKTGFTGPSILLHNGFDEDIFFPASSYNPFRIIYAGALVPLKGVHILIQAFPKIREEIPEATLLVCGSSAMWGEAPYLDQEQISRSLPEISFLGAVPQKELAQLFADSALGVIPTIKRLWEDPFPLTPVEMQACGLPVLVSAAGGLPESIREGSGFVLDSENPDDWANTIISILRDREKLGGMRRACCDNARQRFRWRELITGFLSDLQNIADAGKSSHIVVEEDRRDVIAFLSTFNQPCGIATHTGYVIGGLGQALKGAGKPARTIVLAEDAADRTVEDDDSVFRCWQRGRDNFREAFDIISRERVKVLHIQFQDGLFAGTDIVGLVRNCKSNGVKVFMTFHSSEHSLPLCAELINLSDRSFVHLDQSAVRFIAFGAQTGRIRKVPHGILENMAATVSTSQAKIALELPPELKIVSSFGFFDPYKGVMEIIQAFPAVLQHHNAAFIFLGGGHPSKAESMEYIRKCRAMAESLGISNKIIFADGFLPEKVVSNYLSASDVVVMNYSYVRNEISGAAAFALAHRRPLITSPVPAFSELTECTLQLSQGMDVAQAINLVLEKSSLNEHLKERTERYIAEHSFRKLGEILISEYGIASTGSTSAKGDLKPSPTPVHRVGEQFHPLNIVWEGPQFIHHSLAHVNRELCLQLVNAGHNVSIIPLGEPGFDPEIDPRFAGIRNREYQPLPGPVDVHVRHWYPPDLSPPTEGHWVMIQPWEMGSVPKQWIERMNAALDELWVPTSYVRDCYIKSGLSPDLVRVVPNGIDTALFSPEADKLTLQTAKRFKFIYVGSTTLDRKGFDILLNAYCQEFTKEEDVTLIVKDMAIYTGGNNPLIRQIRDLQVKPGVPEIVVIEDDLLPQQLAGLYASCDCLVHAYRGEGFSLPIAEAMSTRLPVIVTGHGACLDFCDNENAYLIPASESRLPTRHVYGLETVDNPWWAEPDVNELRRLMRHVLNNPNEAERKGKAGRSRILTSFTWEDAAKAMEPRLQEIKNKPIRRFMSKIRQPALSTPTPSTTSLSVNVENAKPMKRPQKNILIISPFLPTYDRDSGSFRLYQILRLIRLEGHHVTFIARGAAGAADPLPYIDKLKELGVEVFPLDPEKLEKLGIRTEVPRLDLRAILNNRHFDMAYLYFYHIALQYLDEIRSISPATKIIVDSVDLHFLRERRAAKLSGDEKLLQLAQQTKMAELMVYSKADTVIAVTDADRNELLTHCPLLTTAVIPNIHPIQTETSPFPEREGILFIGGFPHHPNVDAVLYFCADIWPIIMKRLPDVRLYLVGNSPPDSVQSLASERIIVTGYVPDTMSYLKKCRVSIAPLRYGAGMKGKVGEALAAGLPVVATSIAAEGTGLITNRDLLVEDNPANFAEAVIHLYESDVLWNKLSVNGKVFIANHYSPEVLAQNLRYLIDKVEPHDIPVPKPDKQTSSYLVLGSASQYNQILKEEKNVDSLPLISIIIPLFNKLEYTRQCLEGVALSITSLLNYEIILVDNASTDGTHEYLRTLSGDVTIITNLANLGFARACNKGARLATGDYLVFLNNDTIPKAGWLEALVDGIEHDGADICGSRLIYPDGRIQHAGVAFNEQGIGYHVFNGLDANAAAATRKRFMQCVTAACMIIRRELFETLSGFDEGYVNGFEDVDLCLRAGELGKRILYVPDSTLIHFEETSEGRKSHDEPNARRYLARWQGKVRCDDNYYYQLEGFRKELRPDGRIQLFTVNTEQPASQKMDLPETEALRQNRIASPNCGTLTEKGVSLKLEGRYAEALDVFSDARNKGDTSVLVHAGDCLAKLGKVTEAEVSYLDALTVRGDDALANTGIGVLRLLAGEFSDAALAFGKALQADPASSKALCGMGMARNGQGRNNTAYGYFVKALKIDPENITALNELFRSAFASGKFTDATACARTYLMHHPGDLDILFSLAGVLYKTGAYDEACEVMERLMALSPGYQGAKELLEIIPTASVIKAPSKMQDAVDPYAGDSVACLIEKGRIDKAAANYDKAFECFSKARNLGDASVLADMGDCKAKLGNMDEALGYYEELLINDPHEVRALVGAGVICLVQEKPADADIYLTRALREEPDNARALCGQAMLRNMQGRESEAYLLFTQTLDSDPENLTALFELVKCAYRLERFSDAERHLDNYLRYHPTDLNILFSLAGVLMKMGKNSEALEKLETILLFDPGFEGVLEMQQMIGGQLPIAV
ncbi:MAG TPA: glycosyltransferase [Geobacteraceae bacterium]|nr:glycosyltransferase [Geobacteraceae bacterium]